MATVRSALVMFLIWLEPASSSLQHLATSPSHPSGRPPMSLSAGAAAIWYEIYCKVIMQARDAPHAPAYAADGVAHDSEGALAHFLRSRCCPLSARRDSDSMLDLDASWCYTATGSHIS